MNLHINVVGEGGIVRSSCFGFGGSRKIIFTLFTHDDQFEEYALFLAH